MKIFDLNEATQERAERLIDALFAGNPVMHARWRAVVADPSAGNEFALVLADDDRAHGIALVERRSLGDPDGRLASVWVADGPGGDTGRATRLTALHQEVLVRLRGDGCSSCFTSLPEFLARDAVLLEKLGYELWDRDVAMVWDGQPYETVPVPGVTVARYRGGDSVASARTAALCNRAFRDDPVWVPTDGPGIDRLAVADGAVWFLARENDGGRVVGVAETRATGAFIGIAVDRAYWGRGLADYLAGAAMDHHRERGVAAFRSLVRPSNRASLALHERMGWREDGRFSIFRVPLARRGA